MDSSDLVPQQRSGGRAAPPALVLLGVLVGGMAVGVLVPRWWDGADTTGTVDVSEETASHPPQGVVEISVVAQQNGGIHTARAQMTALPTTLQLTAVVTPVEPRVAHIRPLARGIVDEVSVMLGQRVREGEPLVTIDNIELGERVGEYLVEVAARRQAAAELTVRERELRRAEALIAIEGIAQRELDVRQAAFAHAQAAVASLHAQVARVEEQLHRFGLSEANVAALLPEPQSSGDGAGLTGATDGHRVASHGVLRAPFAGVITAYDVAPGELVDPDDHLFTITDVTEVWVLANVYERDLASVRTDVPVTIALDAYPGRTFPGRLTYVSDVVDPETRTVKVRCVVDNAEGLLKLGMFVRVVIPTGDQRETVVVPAEAIQQIDGQSVVFVRLSPTQFRRRDVETGATAGSLIEIGSGLEPGTEIASAGSFHLKTAVLQDRIGDDH
jgi:cobalt-zinc-cadmium efflux system membrane fusion protein